MHAYMPTYLYYTYDCFYNYFILFLYLSYIGSTFNSTVIFVGFQLIDDLEVISDDTYKVDATFNNISVRFTVSSDITNDPDVTSNLTNIVNTMQSPSDLSDVTFVMHNNGTSDQYNVPIICDLFDNNGVYMVEVIALSEERINAVGNLCVYVRM